MGEPQQDRRVSGRRRKEDDEALQQLARQRRSDRLRWAVPYVFIVVVGAFAFWRADTANHNAYKALHKVEHEALVRDYQQCNAQNESRGGILTFIYALTPAERQSDPRVQQFLALANKTFAPLECPPDPDQVKEK